MTKGLTNHVDISSGARHLILGLSLSLLPYFVCVRSGCLDKSAHMLSLHLKGCFSCILCLIELHYGKMIDKCENNKIYS